jgi:prephenate dehydrogenase
VSEGAKPAAPEALGADGIVAILILLVAATDPKALAIAPRSFLEATRVAKSDPDLWDDILLANRAAVRTALRRFSEALAGYDRVLRRGDRRALLQLLRRSHSIRKNLPE